MPERIASTVTPPSLPSPTPGSLTAMPDAEQTESSADDGADRGAPEGSGGPIVSACGGASAVLGALCAATIMLGTLIWVAHRGDVDERGYQSRVMQAAVDWTSKLI